MNTSYRLSAEEIKQAALNTAYPPVNHAQKLYRTLQHVKESKNNPPRS